MHEHASLIVALGDHAELAEAVSQATGDNIAAEAARKWKRNGIPHRYRVPVLRIADQKGVKVPDDLAALRRMFAAPAAGE